MHSVHGASERVAHGKVESEVAPEVGMDDGIMLLLVVVDRIDCFHAPVETQHYKIEVETNA